MSPRIFLILTVLLGVRCFGAEAAEKSALIFAGYGRFPGSPPVFVIHDPTTDETSPWMRLSEAWHGYAFVKFDAKSEKLTLRKGTEELTLGLKPSKVTAALFGPKLIRGTFTITDNQIVYSADAQLSIGQGIVISADSGAMTADLTLTTISGDLRVTQPGRPIMVMYEGVLDLSGGKMIGQAKRMSMGPLSPEGPGRAP